MPRGKKAGGEYNFRVTRHICPQCSKKGLYIGRKTWIKCMYCNFLKTPSDLSDHYNLLNRLIEDMKGNV